jgi:hypothetical protein
MSKVRAPDMALALSELCILPINGPTGIASTETPAKRHWDPYSNGTLDTTLHPPGSSLSDLVIQSIPEKRWLLTALSIGRGHRC